MSRAKPNPSDAIQKLHNALQSLEDLSHGPHWAIGAAQAHIRFALHALADPQTPDPYTHRAVGPTPQESGS